MLHSKWTKWVLIVIGLVIIGGGVGLATHVIPMPKLQSDTQEVADDGSKSAKQKNQDRQRAQQLLEKNKSTNRKKLKTAFEKDIKNASDDTTAKHITQTLKHNHFVGTALIVKNNKVYYQQGFGYADKADNRKNNANSLFQIASIQKSLTATLLMQQVDKGKVNLDDKIGKYYPGIKGGDEITIRSMLDMHSGFYPGKAPDKMMSDKQLVNYAAKTVKVHLVGVHSYQPINYTLLAGIIEKESGHSYQELVEKAMIKPLKLSNMGFMSTFFEEKNYTIGYSTLDPKNYYKKPIKQTDIASNNQLGTGNIYSSAGDLFKIERAITQGKIIPKASVETLRDTTGGNYGGGVYNFGDYFSSHGVEAGYDVGLTMSKDGKTGVVLLGNRRPIVTTMALSQQLYQNIQTNDPNVSVNQQ